MGEICSTYPSAGSVYKKHIKNLYYYLIII